MPNNSSPSDLNIRLYQGLSRIPPDWQLCLLDGKKVPQGMGWQQKPLTPTQMKEAVMNGWIVDKADGTQYRCYPKGYGLIVGTPVSINGNTFYLMALDQDGASAREKILELSGGEELPKTVAFTSGRPGRCQYLFLVPEQYARVLRTKKFLTGVTGDDGKGEQLELRWTGLQSCLPPSVHPTTGFYLWLPSCAPDEIQIALAPLWILEAMLNEPSESQNSDQLLWQEVATDSTTSPTPRTYHQKQQWTDIDWALSYLTALSPCRADDYNEWCSVGMILKSIDDSLLYEWENWSRQSSKYKPGECQKKWKSFKGNGVGIGTLAHWAKQDGWSSPLKGVKDLAGEIETYISRQETKTEDALELHELLNYRQQQLDIAQILPAPLASALLTKANSDRIDPVYLYQYLLAACGSEMGGHIGILGKEGATVADDWIEYPIFGTMVVALASAGKSQTMRSVFSPIKRRYKQAKAKYKKLKERLNNLEEFWQEKSPKEKEQLKNSLDNPRVFKATMSSPPPKQLIEAGSPEGALRRMSELTRSSGCAALQESG